MRIFDQTFVITYALLAVAIAVAVLGIINTLTALILERTRELALLRVIGMTVAEVRRMIVLESAILDRSPPAMALAMAMPPPGIRSSALTSHPSGWPPKCTRPCRS